MRRGICVAVVLLAGVLTVPATASALVFTPAAGSPLTFTPNDQVRASASADFDEDSADDIASVGTGGINVSLSGGQASPGTFTTAPGSPFGSAATRIMIFAADLNGDSDIDLLTRNGGVTFETWLGNGDGTFSTSPDATVSFAQVLGSDFSATLGDVNGDGDPDLIAGQTGHQFAVALNDSESDGSFTASPSVNIPIPSGDVFSVAIGDWEADGDKDLALAVRNQSNQSDVNQGIYVADGNGTGAFTPDGAPPLFAGTVPNSIATMELDNDNSADLSYIKNAISGDNVLTATGGATGLKVNPDPDGTVFISGAVQQVIANADGQTGLDDIIAASEGQQALGVALNDDNDGNIFLAPGQPFSLPQINNLNFLPNHVISGDFNDDNVADLAADSTNPSNPETAARGIDVLINSPEPDPSVTSVNFPDTAPFNFADVTVTLENIGAARLETAEVSLGGTDSDQFGINFENCTFGVSAGSDCDVDVSFSPIEQGIFSATLDFEFEGVPPLSIPLSGATPADATVDPTSLSFPEAIAGFSAAVPTQALTITSAGGADFVLGTPVFGGDNPGDFSLVDPTACNDPIPAGQSCELVVGFHPEATADGIRQATLTFPGINDPIFTTIPMGGFVTQADFSVAPSSRDFGEAKVGTGISRDSKIFKITSTGNGALPILGSSITGPDASSFAITATTCPAKLAAGQNCDVEVAFDPKTGGAGTRTAQLDLNLFRSSGTPDTLLSLTGKATVDPAPPTGKPALSLKLKAKEKANRGKTLVVSATVKNTGNATAKSIQLKTTVPGSLAKKPKTIKVSSLAAGKSVTKKIKVKVKKSAKKGKKLKVKVVASAAGVASKTATKTAKIK